MAVTPKDVYGENWPSVSSIADEWEKRIDSMLDIFYSSPEPKTSGEIRIPVMSINPNACWSSQVWEEVIRRYTEAGWAAEKRNTYFCLIPKKGAN